MNYFKYLYLLVLLTGSNYAVEPQHMCMRPNEIPSFLNCEEDCNFGMVCTRPPFVRSIIAAKRYCVCKKGTSRDKTDTCVKTYFCKSRAEGKCWGANEEKACMNNCYNECIPVPLVCPELCGCYCKEGYKRNKNGDCVLKFFCNKRKTSKKNSG